MSPELPDDSDAVPPGYRSSLVAAITVLLGFSLLFVRFWSFEAPGEWTPLSVASEVVLFIGVVMEVYTLYRSLRLEDDNRREYTRTLRWLMASAVVVLTSLVIAAISIQTVAIGL